MIDPEKIRPPHFILILLGSAILLEVIFKPGHLSSHLTDRIGMFIFGLGILINVTATRQFARSQTPVPHNEKPTTVVTEGIFKWTRNPMYLGGAFVFLGIALMVGSWPFFAAWIAMGLLLDRVYMPWEEKRMEELFGDEYLDYKKKTRRWI